MDVTLDAKKVIAAPYLPVKAITFNVKVDDGNAQLSKLNMAVASGTVTGKMGLDARKDTPVATAELFLKNLDLATARLRRALVAKLTRVDCARSSAVGAISSSCTPCVPFSHRTRHSNA